MEKPADTFIPASSDDESTPLPSQSPSSEPSSTGSTHQERIRQWRMDHGWLRELVYGSALATMFARSLWVPTALAIVAAFALFPIVRSMHRRRLATKREILGVGGGALAVGAFVIHYDRSSNGLLQLTSLPLLQLIMICLAAVMLVVAYAPRWGRNKYIGYLFLALLIGFLSWRTSHQTDLDDVQDYVESFDRADAPIATWQTFSLAAMSLQDLGRSVNLDRSRASLEARLKTTKEAYAITHASMAGLLEPQDLKSYFDVAHVREHYLPAKSPNNTIHPERQGWAIKLLVANDALSSQERDVLAERIRQSIDVRDIKRGRVLEYLWMHQALLDVIDRPIEGKTHALHVRNSLASTHTRDVGGFASASDVRNFEVRGQRSMGGVQSTWYAIRLMRRFGVPESIDMLAVRSFLLKGARSRDDSRFVAASALAELDTIPNVKKPGFADYLRHDPIWFAVAFFLLVLLCLVVWAPTRYPEHEASVSLSG